MSMSKEEAAAFLEEDLADDGARALREHLARAIPRRLSENGHAGKSDRRSAIQVLLAGKFSTPDFTRQTDF